MTPTDKSTPKVQFIGPTNANCVYLMVGDTPSTTYQMSFPNPVADPALGWMLRYEEGLNSKPSNARLSAAGALETFSYLLSDEIGMEEATRRLRLLRAARKKLVAQHKVTVAAETVWHLHLSKENMHLSEEVMSRVAVEVRKLVKHGGNAITDAEVGEAMNSITRRRILHRYWREVVEGRYSGNVKSFAAIGLEIGVSPARVAQILAKYLRMIRFEVGLRKENGGLTGPYWLDRRVASLNIAPRLSNAMHSKHVETIRDLIRLNKQELMDIPGVSHFGVFEIEQALLQFGLETGMDESVASEIVSKQP